MRRPRARAAICSVTLPAVRMPGSVRKPGIVTSLRRYRAGGSIHPGLPIGVHRGWRAGRTTAGRTRILPRTSNHTPGATLATAVIVEPQTQSMSPFGWMTVQNPAPPSALPSASATESPSHHWLRFSPSAFTRLAWTRPRALTVAPVVIGNSSFCSTITQYAVLSTFSVSAQAPIAKRPKLTDSATKPLLFMLLTHVDVERRDRRRTLLGIFQPRSVLQAQFVPLPLTVGQRPKDGPQFMRLQGVGQV